MLRFAPSPTGDMHIANLRIALFNYIVSKQKKEDFIVRIEDTDKKRNIEGKDKEILEILNLFGIEYSQIVYQSENVRFHTAMALQLIHEKKAFSCFCSTDWLDKKREEANVNEKAYMYDDACANLPAELVIDNTSPFSIRIKKMNSKDFDSFIILNQDKTPTYNFACSVDDMLSDISIVIRSEEHIANTLKQEHIRKALKYEKEIKYIYLPLILNKNAQKMSKSDSESSVKWLLEEGFLPEAILSYLISTGTDSACDVFTLKEAIEWFSLDNISKSPTRFDMKMLKHVNHKYLNALDAKELSRYVGFADVEIGELAKVYLEEVSTTKELKSKIKPIFSKKKIPSELTESTSILVSVIKNAPYFDNYDDFEKYIMEKSGLRDEDFSKSLRYILTGAANGPDISKLYEYLKNYIGEIVK